jgi:hypothetical protein
MFQLKLNRFFYLALTLGFLALSACTREAPRPTANTKAEPVSRVAGPLPDNGFKAQLDLVEAPTKLRAGEKVTVNVHVKNASDTLWYARGGETNLNPDNRYYLAVGNRWLQPDGKLVSNMDGRYGFDRNLKPGEETTLPLQVTAPKSPGDYLLDVDVIQEQVGWFSDKGSPTARTKVTVVR